MLSFYTAKILPYLMTLIALMALNFLNQRLSLAGSQNLVLGFDSRFAHLISMALSSMELKSQMQAFAFTLAINFMVSGEHTHTRIGLPIKKKRAPCRRSVPRFRTARLRFAAPCFQTAPRGRRNEHGGQNRCPPQRRAGLVHTAAGRRVIAVIRKLRAQFCWCSYFFILYFQL